MIKLLHSIFYSFILLLVFVPAFAQNTKIIGSVSDERGPFTITGRILDKADGSPLVGATVVSKKTNTGTIADEDGRFIIILSKDYHDLEVSFVGYSTITQEVLVRGDGQVFFDLEEDLEQLEEVVIYSTAPDANVKGVTLGKTNIDIKTIESLPPFAGEVDVLKSIQLLPGISTVGESSAGFNVRGGAADQNLILLDGITLYNPSHLFGFFSSFNADVISDVTVYKGGIPSVYGGRGSSIVDLSLKKANPSKWGGKASVGTISTKLQLDGPIVKEKLSILLGGRASYANWILGAVNDPDISNSDARFYDANAILNYSMNDNNKFSYSFYYSYDNFKFVNDTTFAWSNMGHSLKWDHAFSESFGMKLGLVSSQYQFNIDNKSGVDNFNLKSKITDNAVNLDFIKGLNNLGSLSFGLQGKYIQISPGTLQPTDSESAISPTSIESEQGVELGAYFQHELSFLNDKFGLSYGLRYSRFSYLGTNTVFTYEPFVPRSDGSITGETLYGENEVIQTYEGFEPRVSLRYSISQTASIKAGFNRINQYIHLITNTTTIAPTDIWKLADPYLKPLTVTQYSLGFFKNFANNTIEASVEGFYKDQINIVEYKDGAELLLNEHVETELLNGNGQSYGVELYLRRSAGFVRGWVGYTYSRSLRQVVGGYPEQTINDGEWYPSNFDKPHDLTSALELQFADNLNFTTILTYSTGRPISYPSAKFNYFGSAVAYFNDRNLERVPNYMRIDVSFNIDVRSRKKVFDGKLTVSIFNLLGRKNAFSVFFDDVPGAPPQAYQLSVLGVPFPSINYSFTF